MAGNEKKVVNWTSVQEVQLLKKSASTARRRGFSAPATDRPRDISAVRGICVCRVCESEVIDPVVSKILAFQARFCMPSATAAPVRGTCMSARVGVERASQLWSNYSRWNKRKRMESHPRLAPRRRHPRHSWESRKVRPATRLATPRDSPWPCRCPLLQT